MPLNQITTYETEHNAAGVSINWRVSTRDARTKLHRFYPFPTNVDGVRVICHSVARNGLIFATDPVVNFGQGLLYARHVSLCCHDERMSLAG